MADNFNIEAVATPGDVAAGDDIGGVKYQRVKITLGADGVNGGDVATGNPMPISDAGGSVTVDGTVAVSSVGGTVTVGDGGGSLTVDTPQLPAALVSGRLDVSVGAALPAGNNNIGDVDIVTVPAPLNVAGNGAAATALRVTMANDSTGIVAATVSQATASNLNAEVQGDQARDAAIAANPVLVAGRGSAAVPSAVSADGDVVEPFLDRSGRTIIAQAAPTGTLSNVSGSASSVTLLASNTSRKGATVYNDSSATLYVKFGATASTTSFTVLMVAAAYYEVPFGYTGIIDGIWASATGSARVTEIT